MWEVWAFDIPSEKEEKNLLDNKSYRWIIQLCMYIMLKPKYGDIKFSRSTFKYEMTLFEAVF